MKKIILSGSTGFIGSEIKNLLIKNNGISLTTIDLRKSKIDINNKIDDTTFDYFIHAAGIHPTRQDLDNINIFHENIKLLAKLSKLFQKSKKIILISSFINLINYKKNKISEQNYLKIYKQDNFYKKSKYITERFFKKLVSKYKKELIIIYPCHVIGPNDNRVSPNGEFLLNMSKKKVKFFFDINYPITDVREISLYIDFIIKKNLGMHKKLIINGDIHMRKYVKMSSFNKKFILIKIYNWIYAIFNLVNLFFKKIKFIKKNYFPISTYKYLKLNPKSESVTDNGYKNKYVVDKTIYDTLNFFKRHE